MFELATVGIDLEKSVFHIHGVDENGRVLVRRSQLLAFFQASAMPDRHGGLRRFARLGTQASVDGV